MLRNLKKLTCLSLLLLSLLGCKALDKEKPILFSSVLSFSNISQSEVKVSWEAAQDNGLIKSTVRYTVYYATKADQLGSIEKIQKNGEEAGVVSATSLKVKGLTDGTTYYFNVIAADESKNEVAYTEGNATTTDVTPPVPGAGGWMYIGATGDGTGSGTYFHLEWVQAADNSTPQGALEYKLIGIADYTLIPDTVTAEEAGQIVYNNDIMKRDWKAGIDTSEIGNYDYVLTLFTVLVAVKDKAGNVAVYTTGYSDAPLGNLVSQPSMAPGPTSGPIHSLQEKITQLKAQ